MRTTTIPIGALLIALAFAAPGDAGASAVSGDGLGAFSGCPGGSQSPVTFTASLATMQDVSRSTPGTPPYTNIFNGNSRLVFTSSSPTVNVTWFDNIGGSTNIEQLSLFATPLTGGPRSLVSYLYPTPNGVAGTHVSTIALPSGANTIEIVNGVTVTLSEGTQDNWGATQVLSAAFPGGCTLNVPQPTVSARLYIQGSSIECGVASTPASQYGAGECIRTGAGVSGPVDRYPGAVVVDAYASGALYDDYQTSTTTNAMLSQLSAAHLTLITDWVLDGGTNDWANSLWAASSFQAALIANLPLVHASFPATHFWLVGPIQRADETSPNTFGSILADYRTADSAVAAALSSYVTYFDAYTCLPFNSTYYSADGVHPNSFGQQTYAQCLMTGIGR